MNEVILNILKDAQMWEIALTIFGAMIATVARSAWMQQIRAKRNENIQNEIIVLAEEAVSSVYNDVVREAKQSGIFDSELKEQAREEAMQRMLEIAESKGSKVLMNLANDAFSRYIELAVNNMKASAEKAKKEI